MYLVRADELGPYKDFCNDDQEDYIEAMLLLNGGLNVAAI